MLYTFGGNLIQRLFENVLLLHDCVLTQYCTPQPLSFVFLVLARPADVFLKAQFCMNTHFYFLNSHLRKKRKLSKFQICYYLSKGVSLYYSRRIGIKQINFLFSVKVIGSFYYICTPVVSKVNAQHSFSLSVREKKNGKFKNFSILFIYFFNILQAFLQIDLEKKRDPGRKTRIETEKNIFRDNFQKVFFFEYFSAASDID